MKITKSEQYGTLEVNFQGAFSFAAHGAFRDILDQVKQPHIEQLTINMREVEFIDSAAMGMLLLARDEAGKHHKILALSGVSGQVKKMFDMANFQNLFILL